MELGNFGGYPTQQILPETGRILVAEPFLSDNYFKRSVVLLTEFTPEGSIGFILNKPLDISIQDVMADTPDFDALVLMGGPVGRDTLHFLHTLGDTIQGSRKIMEGIYWGGDFEKIKELIQSGRIYPDEIKFFIGYSGWSPGQLEQEIQQKSWFVLPGQTEYIMNHDTSHLWNKILKDQGEEYAGFANYPVDPMLN